MLNILKNKTLMEKSIILSLRELYNSGTRKHFIVKGDNYRNERI